MKRTITNYICLCVYLPLVPLILAPTMFGQTRPASTEPPSVSAGRIAKPAGAEYVGSDMCQSCHNAEAVMFGKTRHASVTSKGPDGVSGCEMCHGPGKAHVDAMVGAQGDDAKTEAGKKLIFSFNGNPRENAQQCLTCHISSQNQANYGRSAHLQHGVGCNDCHSMHLVEAGRNPKATAVGFAQANFFNVPKLPEESRWLNSNQLKKSQPDLCFGCHGNIQAQFALPTHHRVPEGAMKCTDCHNTHGTSNRATLRQSGWETCAQCHVEKRGPYVFEHSAVKVEGCTACHTPHGSVNRMLLVRREERFLCLQCHVDPSAVNVPHSRLSFQTRGDCTRCHSAIHGSNFDPAFLH